jgi:hypothetical protein
MTTLDYSVHPAPPQFSEVYRLGSVEEDIAKLPSDEWGGLRGVSAALEPSWNRTQRLPRRRRAS